MYDSVSHLQIHCVVVLVGVMVMVDVMTTANAAPFPPSGVPPP